MKNVLLTILGLSLTPLFAQSEFNYGSNYHSTNARDIVYMIPGVKNRTVTVETKNLRSGKTYKHQKTFNEFSYLTEHKSIKKGEISLVSVIDYNSNGKMTNYKEYKRGNLKWEHKTVRDNQDRKIAFESHKKGSSLKTKSTWTYKENAKCLENSVLYAKNGVSIKKKWNYEYYSDCEKKQSTLTNSKGKVLKTWTYDCKREGEELQKKKDVKQICSWEETNDAHLIKVQQTFDEKGKVIKMVAKYRSIDTSLVSYKRYNSDNELTSESISDPDLKKQLSYKSYKNGKLKYQTIYKYDTKKLVSYAWYKGNKKRYNTKYEYNSNDELVAMTSFKNEDKLSRTTTVTYQ